MRRLLLVLALTILLIPSFTGCMGNEDAHTPPGMEKEIQPASTPEDTLTPPPGINTPIPPHDIVRQFFIYYNQRNSTLLYSMFSDRVKANHTLEDVEKHLEIAENHSIEIIEWEYELLFSPELRIVKTNLTVEIDGDIVNTTVDFPVIYVRYERSENGFRVIGFNESIDSWPFDEIHSLVRNDENDRS